MTNNSRPISALFTLAALVTAVATLHIAREVLIPIALAILVSFLLAPLADRLERWKLGRIPSVLAVVCVAFMVLGSLGWVVTSQLVDLSSNLAQYRENIVDKVREVTAGSKTFRGVTETIEDVTNELTTEAEQGDERDQEDADDSAPQTGEFAAADKGAEESGEPEGDKGAPPDAEMSEAFAAWAERIWTSNGAPRGESEAMEVKVISMPPTPLAQVQGWMGPLMAPLTAAGMVVVLVIFMLLQREDQRNRLIRLFGVNNIHATTEALTDIVDRVSRYLRMQFLINAGYGFCVGAGLALIGLPNAVMFGVMSFSLRFLPYIGPWISAALPVAVSIAITEGWTQAMMVVSLFIVLELIVNNVAEPLLYASSIGVSGMGVILAAIFWTWLWGTIGLVLAMPLTVCLVVAARYIPSLRFITVMLGDQPTLTHEERIYQRMLALDEDEVRDLADEYFEDEHATPTEFYDRVLLPALQLAERDRDALTDEQRQGVQEVARELMQEIAARSAAAREVSGARPEGERDSEPAAVESTPGARVLCVPLRDEGDETSALILGQLLEEERLEPLFTPIGSLTSEVVEAVASQDVDMVIVSVLPPLPQRDSRLLCRRLRKRYPALPIFVGFWDGSAEPPAAPQLLAGKGDGEIVTTLAQAVVSAQAIASRTPSVSTGAEPGASGRLASLATTPSREAG